MTSEVETLVASTSCSTNVWVKKTWTNRSSDTLLQLFQFFLFQTLFSPFFPQKIYYFFKNPFKFQNPTDFNLSMLLSGMTSEVLSLVASTSFSTSKVLSSKKDNSCHIVLPRIHLELCLKLGIKIWLFVRTFLKMTYCFFQMLF